MRPHPRVLDQSRRIVSEIKVDLPQPRDRLDPEFRELVERIYIELTARPAGVPRDTARAERFPGTGIGTILPRVSTNLLAGLIEAVAGLPYNGEADLPVIARFASHGGRPSVPGRRDAADAAPGRDRARRHPSQRSREALCRRRSSTNARGSLRIIF